MKSTKTTKKLRLKDGAFLPASPHLFEFGRWNNGFAGFRLGGIQAIAE